MNDNVISALCLGGWRWEKKFLLIICVMNVTHRTWDRSIQVVNEWVCTITCTNVNYVHINWCKLFNAFIPTFCCNFCDLEWAIYITKYTFILKNNYNTWDQHLTLWIKLNIHSFHMEFTSFCFSYLHFFEMVTFYPRIV